MEMSWAIFGVLIAQVLELRDLLDGRFQGGVRPEGRDELGDPVHFGERDLEDAADVPDGGPGGHRPEGDDLADVLLAVFLRDVFDHLLPAPAAEVDVDVGQADALRVEEALEQEVVLDRVDRGDAHAVGDHAPGRRAASRTDGNALLAGVLDEVPDDEEVALEAHLLDEPDLSRQPFLVLFPGVAELAVGLLLRPDLIHPLPEPLAGDLLEILAQGLAVRRLEDGEEAA